MLLCSWAADRVRLLTSEPCPGRWGASRSGTGDGTPDRTGPAGTRRLQLLVPFKGGPPALTVSEEAPALVTAV